LTTNTINEFGDHIRRFMKTESSAGLVLMAATVAAMIVMNSPLSGAYESLLLLEGQVRIGDLSIEKPVFLWVNDLWMAVFFFLVGIVMWVCVLKSGVHATLAGVVLALSIPAHSQSPDRPAPLGELIHALHPWVAFGILPAFAFVNAGIDFQELRWDSMLAPVPLGIICGLLAGTQIGVFVFAWITIRLGFAKLPARSSWIQLYGIAALCGIGFTMSLFIGSLSFEESGIGYERPDRFAIILASALSGVLGYLVLRYSGNGTPGNGAAGDGT
jgi:Na+/H+ antiporter NhaA